MNYCPCCSQTMLRHISNHRIYWYCVSCHQEMPNFKEVCQKPNHNLLNKNSLLFLISGNDRVLLTQMG